MSVPQTESNSQTHLNQLEMARSSSVWKNRNYVILFISGALLTLGSKLYELTLPLLLYQISHFSAVAMTTMRAIEFLPNLILALFIGVFVDRVNKKRWILSMIFFQIAILASLFWIGLIGKEKLVIYYLAGFLLMTFSYSYGNGRISIVKHALPSTLLTSANASFSFVSTLIGIMGPSISGFILMMSDLHDGFLFIALAFTFAFIITLFLKTAEPVSHSSSITFWQDLQEGIVELRKNRALWQITLLVIFLNSTSGMFDAMTVFFAKEQLHLESAQLGLVLSTAGIGGLIGSLVVGSCRRRFRTGHLLGASIFFLSIAYFLMYTANGILTMSLALFLEGGFGTILNVCIWTFRQESTPSHLIGRISGLTGSIFKLGMVFTIFGSGWIANWFGASCVFLSASIANLLLFGVYLLLPLKNLE